MINISQVIRKIEGRLGYKFQMLELSTEEIVEVLKQDTLLDFSMIFPYIHRVKIDTALDRVSQNDSRFYINSPFRILMINDVIYNDRGLYGTGGAYNGNIIMDQISSNLKSLTHNPLTYKFIPPNIIEIMPKYNTYGNILVETQCIHPSFNTIPNKYNNTFFKLALKDVCIYLRPLRQKFENMSTPYGSINLNMDLINEQADSRDDYYQDLKLNKLKYSHQKKIFIK